jgi:FixJ family two-component response regulator/signal transduction histidine kinase
MKKRKPGRLAFERMLVEVTSSLAEALPGAIVEEVEKALKRLVTFFGYDRCTYGEFGADGSVNVLCSAGAPGVKPHPLGAFGEEKSWFLGELRAGRPVILSALPKGLPPHAKAEAADIKRTGLRSHLSIPLHVRGRTTAVLSFAGFRKAYDWPAEMVTRLTIFAELFSGALARARAAQEAQQLRLRLWHADRVARVGALTAAIAHEINQPLAAILSNAQAGLANLGRGEATPEALRAILEAVVRDDNRAARTIRTMRAFLRRDESGRERLDLATALQEVVALLSSELARHGIRVETDLVPGCRVTADRMQIEQVLLNLVLNAAAAMETRAPHERLLRVSSACTGRGKVAVEVRDSGVGIPAEHLDSVFEPLWTTRKDGLGLGLAICRSIIEAHEGEIRVDPNPDRGVTFRFELACERVAPMDPRQSTAEGGKELLPETASAEVGVVDDDPAVRDGVSRLLAAEGYTAVSYASAVEFLARAPGSEPGCLVLDNRMPGMSGLELLRQLAGQPAAPLVVFLTGSSDVASGVEAMKLGAIDFIEKPADGARLVAAVRRALDAHAARRESSRERREFTSRLARLSAREREVMQHVIRGRLNKQIAADLDIALQTVKQHRSRVMAKMGVRSVAELVRAWDAAGEQREPTAA